MSPLFGVINFNIKANIVLLPAPEAPTNAVTSPLLISKLIFLSTLLSFL